MGKKRKQGGALRARRRADAAATEIVERTASETESGHVHRKADEDLFVLDTTARNVSHLQPPKKKRKVDGDGRKLPKNRMSERDERMARRLICGHGAEGVVALAREGRERLELKRKPKLLAGRAKTNFDLWDDGGGGDAPTKVVKAVPTGQKAAAGTAPVQIELKPRTPGDGLPEITEVSGKLRKAREAARLVSRPTVAVDVAGPGQSYRPDPEAHQDAIGEAVALELRRVEALEYERAPISGGMSEETKAILVGSSEEESESSDDSGDDEEEGEFRPHRKREKLTRAQRNKQKRVRAERAELAKRREKKRLLASVADAKKLARELAKEEKEKAERREVVRRLKAEAAAKPLGTDLHEELAKRNPISAPAIPVALTEELRRQGGGRLRTVKPKGSLLKDRMESLSSRKMANRKALVKKHAVQGKRRKMKGEKHGGFLVM